MYHLPFTIYHLPFTIYHLPCTMLDFIAQLADLDKIAHLKIKNLFFLDDIFRCFLAYFKKILYLCTRLS